MRYESKVDIDCNSSDGEQSAADEKLIDNMRSDNKLVQLFALPKILKILQPITEKKELSTFDKTMLECLLTKTVESKKQNKAAQVAGGKPIP